MNPSVEDRLNSVVRALTGVILPALPVDAALAREQAMLAAGHLQIIVAQLAATPAYEREEADDVAALGGELVATGAGGDRSVAALETLAALLRDESDAPAAARTRALQDAIDAALVALAIDGDPAALEHVKAAVCRHGVQRAEKDRQWFAAMGFDIDYS